MQGQKMRAEILSVLGLELGRNQSECALWLQTKCNESNVTKHYLIPRTQYQGTEPQSQLTLVI